MNLEQFKAHIKADEEARAAKPWFIRIPLNVGEFIWYRMILKVGDWPRNIKMAYQRLVKGYCDRDIWNLNYFIVKKLRAPFKEFTRYQEEQGHSLPMEFETDPAGWLVVLSKIEYALDHAYQDDIDGDFDFTAKMTDEQRNTHHEKVAEGFKLLGIHIRDFWD